jgi:uncharacterized protein DUF6755
MQTESARDFQVRERSAESSPRESRSSQSGSAAVWQARLIMLVMINIAQLWILAATVDAALARHYSVLLPLVVASAICFLITLSILRWWRPRSGQRTSSGYLKR